MMENTKICYVCEENKSTENFYKDKSKSDGFKSCCKECGKLLVYSWRARKGPEKMRDYRLMSTYGIGIKEYNQMFVKQNGCCDICGKHQSELKRGFAVDHCHNTGKVRALLCHKCNTGIGNFEENIETLKEAICYIMRHSD